MPKEMDYFHPCDKNEIFRHCMLPRERALAKHIVCARTAVEFRNKGEIWLARMAAHDARNNFHRWVDLMLEDANKHRERDTFDEIREEIERSEALQKEMRAKNS